MRLMGLQAIYPKPNLSTPHPEHKKYPYLMKDMVISKPDDAWATDITYIRLERWVRVSDGDYILMMNQEW